MSESIEVDVVPERPKPTHDELTAGFWAAAREHRLVVQRCSGCSVLRHYPQPMCPECRSRAWEWTPVSGYGTIYTYTVTHQAFHAAWADRLPFAVATIELDEGPRMVSDLPPDDVDRVAIGERVECFFEDHTTEGGDIVSYPRFRLVSSPADQGP